MPPADIASGSPILAGLFIARQFLGKQSVWSSLSFVLRLESVRARVLFSGTVKPPPVRQAENRLPLKVPPIFSLPSALCSGFRGFGWRAIKNAVVAFGNSREIEGENQ
jgi:hypothetical protein